eukprot:TRINITY_DN45533_c0_g1_i1.p1 TRINITY_DN45533_c0_g1~~TRINITY_DN45533_c0_g1_i1.p1  ORF type:complete len:318 (+),score=68.00 TRINITY_DN45533_c0_g1_i1:76-954(+)
MIDAYDVLGVSLTATESEIKKAFQKLSLRCHPDKVQASGDDDKDAANTRWLRIQEAKDILQDSDRKKVYDTFGIDLGVERPEMEVWTIGVSTLLSPLGSFLLKTVVARVVLWLLGWRWIGRILMLLGVASWGLYFGDVHIREVSCRSPEAVSVFLPLIVIDVVIVLNWLWPLLAEAVIIFYLASEIFGMESFFDSWKIGSVVGVVSLLLGRLLRGWWWWIVGLEVLAAVVLLVALTISSGIMRLWIDSIQTQHGEKLLEWRKSMRKEREKLENEVAELKQKLEGKKATATAK